MVEPLVLVRRDGPVCTVTINRPDARNALNTETVVGLREAFRAARADDSVRVIVLTGSGTVFCAGADLQSFRAEMPELERYQNRRHLAELFLEMTALGKPTVARVNGHALAGGLGVMAACDLAVAVEDAQFGMPEVNVGVWPMMIMAIIFRNMPRKVGMDLMLTGRRMTALEAREIGLINRCVRTDELDRVVSTLAQELAEKSPAGMRLGLEAFHRMWEMPFPDALAYLQDRLALLTTSEDTREGIAAFFEKRSPRFKGR